MIEAPVAIITGAGSGIGRATALRLGDQGYALVLAGRRRDALAETAELCSAGEILIVPADLRSQPEAEEVIDAAAQAYGRIDVLVNNAGFGQVVPIASQTPEQFHETLLINTYAPAWMTMRAWPVMQRQRKGCIINIGSMAIYDPYPGFFAYAASKAALALMTLSISKEGSPAGIRAFCIAPGATETRMLRASFDTATLPADACLDPAVVAGVVARCAAGELEHLNGQTIPVLAESAKALLLALTKAHPSAWLNMHPQ